MRFTLPSAETFVPDGTPLETALARTTHLSVGAHSDDLEFMSLHGIFACWDSPTEWFTGVTCTDGAGCSRKGPYAHVTNEEMKVIRRKEQNDAAVIGRYSAMLQLDFPSIRAHHPRESRLKDDLAAILQACKPRVVYTHNLADKHETHVAVTVELIQAIREMPEADRPEALYGCEGWRALDWLRDDEKIVHDISARQNLAAALGGVFDSQITGGKRYDLATFGRWRANATFLAPLQSDEAELAAYAMDMTPLVRDPSLDLEAFTLAFVDRLRDDVQSMLRRRLAK